MKKQTTETNEKASRGCGKIFRDKNLPTRPFCKCGEEGFNSIILCKECSSKN